MGSSSEFNAIISRGKKLAQQRERENPRLDPPPAESPIIAAQLPLWREQYRGVPNALIRSALFTVRSTKVPREYLKDATIAALSNITIKYTGEELRQDDASVFMQLLHAARTEKLGEDVRFVAGSFIRALGWSRASDSWDRLRQAILRLTATVVHVSVDNGRVGYGASLIRSFKYQSSDGEPLKRWTVTLEPSIAALFGDEAYTRVLLEQRLKMKRSVLAQWLHLYYASHREPYPQTVAALHRLSGSEAKTLFHFRQTLFKALDELKRVGFLKSWQPTNDDKILVERAQLPELTAIAA
jgi:hypothetical protein